MRIFPGSDSDPNSLSLSRHYFQEIRSSQRYHLSFGSAISFLLKLKISTRAVELYVVAHIKNQVNNEHLLSLQRNSLLCVNISISSKVKMLHQELLFLDANPMVAMTMYSVAAQSVTVWTGEVMSYKAQE